MKDLYCLEKLNRFQFFFAVRISISLVTVFFALLLSLSLYLFLLQIESIKLISIFPRFIFRAKRKIN